MLDIGILKKDLMLLLLTEVDMETMGRGMGRVLRVNIMLLARWDSMLDILTGGVIILFFLVLCSSHHLLGWVGLEVRYGVLRLKIGWLQFDADAIAAHLCSAINLAADAKKRR